MASAYRRFAVVLGAVAICAVLVLLPREEIGPRLRLGENMVYGIYVEGAKVGSWKMSIEEKRSTWENVPCYRANYSMELGAIHQGGWMEFHENGELRHARVWFIQGGEAKWATEIAYHPSLNLMQIVRENYEDDSRFENLVPMPRETTIAEHLWYVLRLEPLKPGYTREFDLNAFPDATQLVPAEVKVTAREKIETFAGTFDCWLVQGRGPFDWMWVEKNGRLVARVQERSGGQTRVFVLESYG